MRFTSDQAVQVGIIFKILYRFFFRRKIEKAVKNSKNTIDDRGLDMIDKLVGGE